MPVKFWNVMLDSDGGDHLDRSCEKQSSYYTELMRKGKEGMLPPWHPWIKIHVYVLRH